MPRRNHKEKVFRCRTKNNGEPISFLTQGKPPKKGHVTSVTKVSPEELYKIGGYFKLGDDLMRDFLRLQGKNPPVPVTSPLLKPKVI